MKLKNFLNFVMVGTSLLLMNACGMAPTETGSFEKDDGVSDSFNDTLLKGVTEIEFDSNNAATVNVSEINEDGTYVVALYSYDDTNDAYSYQLGTAGSTGLSAGFVTKAATDDATEDAHEALRRLEEELAGSEPASAPRGRALVKSASVGSTRSFKVLNNLSSGGSYDVVTAQLRYQSGNFDAYVDVRNEEAFDEEDFESLLSSFDSVVDSERDLFGEESDVNGDGRFAVLFTQAVNELGGSGGGIITGFFYGADLYSSGSYSVSNQMEIIYAMVPDPIGQYGTRVSTAFALSNILPVVLPHEYQHMISYNQHVFVNGGSQEEAWLNEGLSHLAEDIYSLEGGYMAETGIDNPARVAYYLNNPESVCFTCGSSLSQRGGSYLFLRYLYEQAEKGNMAGLSSGADLIARLMMSEESGIDNILAAALETDDLSGFKFLIGRFALALYFAETGLTSDSRYGFDGILLRGEQNDNRGTILDGPETTEASLPFSGSVVSSGISYISLSGEQIIATGGTLPVALSASMQGGGYLIELDAL